MSDPDELYLRAMEMLRTQGDAKRAMEMLQQAATSGHIAAATHLGKAYELGEHVARDAQQAEKWHALATASLLEALRSLPDDEPAPPPSTIGSFSRQVIASHLEEASTAAIALARKLVVQQLPESLLFVLDNATSPGIHLERGGRKLELGRLNDPRPLAQVVDWLWYDGHVPMWVDIYAQRVDERHTYLALMRSPGFIAEAKRLYHVREGYPPFHVAGLIAPAGWTSVEKDGRFKLGWVYDAP